MRSEVREVMVEMGGGGRCKETCELALSETGSCWRVSSREVILIFWHFNRVTLPAGLGIDYILRQQSNQRGQLGCYHTKPD